MVTGAGELVCHRSVIPLGGVTLDAVNAKSPTSRPASDALMPATDTDVPVAVASAEFSMGEAGSTPVYAPMPPEAATALEKVTV
jgi:hypothetical protein